jgi:membrane-associated phospholipid phosphatase
MRSLLASIVLLAFTSEAHAATPTDDPGFVVNWAIDGSVLGGEIGLSLLAAAIHVDKTHHWRRELLPFDIGVRKNFSAGADALSNATFSLVVVTPLFAELGHGIDATAGKRSLLYGETLGAALLLNAFAKYTVQRPRPYTYNPSAMVKKFSDSEGEDSRVSFFSGHSALTFAAAVGGSYLFAEGSTDLNARAVMWGVELGLAAMTANLRVIAGRHFYSDIIVGAIVGAGVGFGMPLMHESARGPLEPSGREWIAMGSGLVVGTFMAHILPLKHNIVVPLVDGEAVQATIAPMASPSGGGLMLLGTF